MKTLLLILTLAFVSCQKPEYEIKILDGTSTWVKGCNIYTSYNYTIYRRTNGQLIPVRAETALKTVKIPGCDDSDGGGVILP